MKHGVLTAVLIAALAVCILPPGALSDDSAAGELQDKIDSLIKQLGSEDFEQREDAQTQLIEIGEPAREALERAKKSADSEISLRAKNILKAIDMVHLVFVCANDAGEILKNTKVTVKRPINDDEETKWDLVTDANGKCSIEMTADAPAQFNVSTEGYAPAETTLLQYQKGIRQNVCVKLPRFGTIKGTVVDAANKPVPNASVSCWGEGKDIDAETDEKGQFELKDVPPGAKQLHADTRDQSGYERVIVPAGGTVEVTIKLKSETGDGPNQSQFKCTVLLPDGKRLQNADGVSVESKPLPDETRKDTQDVDYFDASMILHPPIEVQNGELTASLECCGKAKLRLIVPGYKKVDLGEVELKSDKPCVIAKPITLEKGIEIEVTVVDAANKPIPNAKVVVHPADEGQLQIYTGREDMSSDEEEPQQWGRGTTGKDGKVTISGLDEGETGAIAYADDYVASECKTVIVGKNAVKIIITLVKPAHADITVIDAATKKPIENAELIPAQGVIQKVSNDIIRVEDHSRFRPGRSDINPITPGRRYIIAQAPGYKSGYYVAEFKPGEVHQGSITLTKTGTGNFAGRIVGCEGTPLSEVNCVIINKFGEMQMGMRSHPSRAENPLISPMVLRLKADGTFTAQDLPEGGWAVTVRNKDDRILGTATFLVEKGKTAQASVTLRPRGSIEVTLNDQTGKPLADTALMLVHADLAQYISEQALPGLTTQNSLFDRTATYPVMTDDKGKCKFENICVGDYCVNEDTGESSSLVGGMRSWPVKVEAGKTTQTTLVYDTTLTTIEGRVLQPDLASKIVLIPDSDNPLESIFKGDVGKAFINSDGSFKFTDVPAGKYIIAGRLNISDAPSTRFAHVEVKSGVPVKGVEIQPLPKLHKFSGKIANYALTERPPMVPFSAIILLMGESFCFIEVMPDGTFEGMAPAGEYHACIIDIVGMYTGEKVRPPVKISIHEDETKNDKIEIK